MREYLEVLRRVELLEDLDDASLAEIAASGEEIVYPGNGYIYHSGDVGTHFFIVLEGSVSVVITDHRSRFATASDRRGHPVRSAEGRERRVTPAIITDPGDRPRILLKTHPPGGFFGEMSLLTGDPVSADVVATEDTHLLRLTKQVFEATFTKNPSVLLRLNRILSRYLSSTNVMVCNPRLAKLNVIHRSGESIQNNFASLYIASSVVQQTNRRVILVDCESILEGPLRSFAPPGEQDALDVFDPRRTFAAVSDFLKHCVILGERFHILTFPKPLSRLPGVEWSHLRDLITLICRLYDVVIVDTGHIFDLRAAKIMTLADKIFLLASHVQGHAAVTRLVKELDLSPSQAVKRLRIGLVGNFDFNRRSSILEPLVEATGNKNVFLLAESEVNNVRMSPELQSVIEEKSPTGRRLASLAREIAGCRVGIALGAGGAKGFAHIGVWRVIEELRIPVDVIVGCSMGAIIGAALAMGNNSYETEQMMRRIWTPKGAFFDWQIPPWTNIIKGSKVDRMNHEAYGNASILDCAIPYASLAFDLVTGQEIVIDEGLVKNAVRASGSMPIIMRPVTWKNHYLIDGGVTNKVPVDVLAAMGTDFNIAVNVSPEDDPSFFDPQTPHAQSFLGMMKSRLQNRSMRGISMEPSLFQIVSRWYSTSSTKITEAHLHLANVTLRPATEGIGTLDWQKFDKAVAAGITCAQKHAEEIKSKLSALRGR
jgi:NTE family protein